MSAARQLPLDLDVEEPAIRPPERRRRRGPLQVGERVTVEVEPAFGTRRGTDDVLPAARGTVVARPVRHEDAFGSVAYSWWTVLVCFDGEDSPRNVALERVARA